MGRNGRLPYNIFSKWYKDTRKRIVEVSVEGRPSEVSSQDSQAGDTTPLNTQCTLRIMVDIAMSNGLRLSQKNKTFRFYGAYVS